MILQRESSHLSEKSPIAFTTFALDVRLNSEDREFVRCVVERECLLQLKCGTEQDLESEFGHQDGSDKH